MNIPKSGDQVVIPITCFPHALKTPYPQNIRGNGMSQYALKLSRSKLCTF